MMRGPKEVYDDFAGRRKGILAALTTEVDKFYTQADPAKDNLCLFGYPDGTWAVDLPAEEVPPEVPEPPMGINFARDGMQKQDWLGLVAVHSDAWLLALAFYKGARLHKEGREELFRMINAYPTCYEIVSGRVKDPAAPAAQAPGVSKRASNQGGRPSAKSRRVEPENEEDELGPGDDGWEDGEGEPCPQCGRRYRTDEFWIACDVCDTWYCGRCAKMTEAKADRMKSWRCGRDACRNAA